MNWGVEPSQPLDNSITDYISNHYLTFSICILSDLDPLLFITFILHSIYSLFLRFP